MTESDHTTTTIWDYEIQEDVEAVVGEVNGHEITRFVDVLSRPDAEP